MTAPGPKLERTTFRTSRLMEFCTRKELVAQTGHPAEEWPLVILKELVDNSLDACEEADIAPAISVTVDSTGITVSDNGPGIPEETVEDVLDFSVRVSSREAYVSPTRGAQGNALKTLVAMPFTLDGNEGTVTVAAAGIEQIIRFGVDQIRQQPAVDVDKRNGLVTEGTRIAVEWPDSACSILEDAGGRFLQIADAYLWLNPHLTLDIDWFGDHHGGQATDASWRKWKPSDPTSPHWYSPEHLERLVAGYVAHDAETGRPRTVRELVSEFRGLTSSAKQKSVLDATGLARASLGSLCADRTVDRGVVTRLLEAMQELSKPVKPRALGIIGKEHLTTRMEAAGCEPDSIQYQRAFHVEGSIPQVIEVVFGYAPAADHQRVVTGVNWSPGIGNPFRQLGAGGRSMDSILGAQMVDEDDPVVIVAHLASPRVEYTDRGKSAVVMQ